MSILKLITEAGSNTQKSDLLEIAKKYYPSDFALYKESMKNKDKSFEFIISKESLEKKSQNIVTDVNLEERENSDMIKNAMAELTDDEIKDKFDGDITLALKYINEVRVEIGMEEIESKSFSKKFFENFRATFI